MFHLSLYSCSVYMYISRFKSFCIHICIIIFSLPLFVIVCAVEWDLFDFLFLVFNESFELNTTLVFHRFYQIILQSTSNTFDLELVLFFFVSFHIKFSIYAFFSIPFDSLELQFSSFRHSQTLLFFVLLFTHFFFYSHSIRNRNVRF